MSPGADVRARDERGGGDQRDSGADVSAPFLFPVRVRPGASRTAVGGRYDGRYGVAVVVAVNAPAVDGRATEAVLRATASALGLKRSAVAVRAGGTSRDKLLAVADPPPDLADRLRTIRDGPRERSERKGAQ
jgi:uncharacterized protein